MYNSSRSKYSVIKDFVAKIPVAHDTIHYNYTVGDEINLRDTGSKTQEWLNKGLIKKVSA